MCPLGKGQSLDCDTQALIIFCVVGAIFALILGFILVKTLLCVA